MRLPNQHDRKETASKDSSATISILDIAAEKEKSGHRDNQMAKEPTRPDSLENEVYNHETKGLEAKIPERKKNRKKTWKLDWKPQGHLPMLRLGQYVTRACYVRKLVGEEGGRKARKSHSLSLNGRVEREERRTWE
jgi:hypothetical protein